MTKITDLTKALVVALASLALAMPGAAKEAGQKKHAKPAASSSSKGAKAAPAKDNLQTLKLYDFETDLDGWRIPEWAFAKNDNAGQDVALSSEQAASGKQSLKVNCHFPPKMWSGAYVEIERESGNYMDFTGHQYVMADVFVPADAPPKMKGEIILTVGENWSWTEMRKAVELTPGAWTTIKADITPDGTDWKVRMTDELRADVRKLGVRVSSNSPDFKGTVFIDNIRLGSQTKK